MVVIYLLVCNEYKLVNMKPKINRKSKYIRVSNMN